MREQTKRSPDLWFQHGMSDEVVRCVMATRAQLKRELPEWAGDHEYALASLFVAHELLGGTWKQISRAGNKARSFKLAEAMADITQILIDLTGRTEDQVSGKLELERRKARPTGG